MSHIDELIADLCPRGVQFKTLGDVGTFIRGNGLQKKDFVDSGVGCIHYGQIHTYYRTWATKTVTFVSTALAKRLRYAHPGDLVIATTSEDDEAVGKAVAWVGTEDVAVSSDAYVYRHSLDPKYVAYFFQSEQFRAQKKPYITGTKVRRISGERLAKIRIPVPPLEIQREIVKVLDTFTMLEAELEAELAAELKARRQQYQYYRDALLTFADDACASEASASKQASKQASIRWRTLSEIGSLYGGLTNKSKKDFGSGNVRYVSYLNVLNNIRTDISPDDSVIVKEGESQNRVRCGDVLFTASSETANDVGMSSVVTAEPRTPLYLNSFCFGFRPNNSAFLSPDFAKHLFRAPVMRAQIVRTASGVTRFNVSKERFRRLQVPIPSLDEQQRIAAILDEFDALVNDLSIGLPEEIKARRQQYEYYRDRLLTFREAA